MTRLPRLALCGPGRSGKDDACDWLADNTPLRRGRSTSHVIAPFAAERLGLSVEAAFERRHEDRVFWYELGNELCDGDPVFLVREAIRDAELINGLRRPSEVIATRTEGVVDLFIWIERDVPPDPTMCFGPELCDVIVDNNGTIEAFHAKLAALAKFARLI